MNQHNVKVLLLGKNQKALSSLRQRLQKRGCDCWFADSPEQCSALLDTHKFALILGTDRVGQAICMAPVLDGVNCSVFCCYPVEKSCWWLPLVGRAHKSIGAPGLRPCQFLGALDRIIGENRLGNLMATAVLERA